VTGAFILEEDPSHGDVNVENIKVEQNDQGGAVLNSCREDLECGGVHIISLWQPTVIIDSHMHLQSGRCAPLQFVQSLSALTTVMSRGWIESSGSVGGYILECLFEPLAAPARALGRALSDEPQNPQEGFFRASPVRELSEESKKTTKEIGVDFMVERNNVHDNYLKKDPFYQDASQLVLSSVVMTMDMEYAHIDGYFGIKVYNALYKTKEDLDKDEPVAYWTPQHGRWIKKVPAEAGSVEGFTRHDRGKGVYVKIGQEEYRSLPQTREEYEGYQKTPGIVGTYYDVTARRAREVRIAAVPVLLPDSETKKYENWGKQIRYTEQAVLANPLKLLPMFHYDPRRWQMSGNAEPMAKVTGKGIYLGFKMYSAQGFRPWDPRLPVLEDFYARCCKSRIPIMNHCTPGGAASFEREEYRDFEHPGQSPADSSQKQGRSKLEYFNEHFVSPEAWKVVLDRTVELEDSNTRTRKTIRLNNLHLCLAHFGGPSKLGMQWNRQIIDMIQGGKYPNLYTDISSSFADSGFRNHFKEIITSHPEIKHRILFGTDWFMTFFYRLLPTAVGKNFWDYCVGTRTFLDSFDTSLWPTFTQYNPYRFYRLDEQIERIARNIIEQRQAKENRNILGAIKRNYIDGILKEAAYIKVANQGHVNYEETP
jgi:predicted TIM-barrel fold metal-dependent hydrolase